MSNLVKQVYVIGNGDEKRVINTNAHAEEILQARNAPFQQIFREGDMGNTEGFDGSFLSEHAEEVSLPSPEELLANAKAQAEQLLSETEGNVQAMLEQAQADAQALKEEAKSSGYNEGMAQAQAEKEDAMVALQREFSEKQKQLETEYSENMENLEAELIDTILPIFQKVLEVDMEQNKNILLYLCRNAIHGLESDKQFFVRTSPENREYFMEHKDEIMGNLPSDVNVEFLSDTTLTENGCLIETESGMVDCGADTQLNNLMDAIRKLSRV